mmetsp:Transcript_37612/g.45771  ORF Transcript_37612/g.45771 Transcript_37612/m.45771 type:complete len:229 (-) Transcript_37612:221-907(-)
MVSMANKRRDRDVMKIMVSGYKVELPDETKMSELILDFPGPKDSPYVGGIWKVRVTLPDQYPIKSPSIGFLNKIYHPNIDEASGSVCLDVINQTWSPMYDLVNIFDTFLPQLLLYPNPTDPLNNEAASLQLKSEEHYLAKIKEYVALYASDHLPKKAAECAPAEEEVKGAGEQVNTNHSSEGHRPKVGAEGEAADSVDESGDEVKEHESELSETSGIEMMEIDDDEDD